MTTRWRHPKNKESQDSDKFRRAVLTKVISREGGTLRDIVILQACSPSMVLVRIYIGSCCCAKPIYHMLVQLEIPFKDTLLAQLVYQWSGENAYKVWVGYQIQNEIECILRRHNN